MKNLGIILFSILFCCSIAFAEPWGGTEGTDIMSTGEVADKVLTSDGSGRASWEVGGGTPEGTAIKSTGVDAGKVPTADGSDGTTWETPTVYTPVTLSSDAEAAGLSITDQEIDLKLATTFQSGALSYTNTIKIEANDTDTKIVNRIRDETTTWTGPQSFENIHLAAGSITNAAVAAEAIDYSNLKASSNYTDFTGDWKTTGYMSGQIHVIPDASGDITAVINADNYGTDTTGGNDVEIPDGACDDASDVGNWLVVTTSAADKYSLVSLDASNAFTVGANADAYTAGYELDIDGTQVCVMCIAAELWKVTGYMGAVPTDGGVAD